MHQRGNSSVVLSVAVAYRLIALLHGRGSDYEAGKPRLRARLGALQIVRVPFVADMGMRINQSHQETRPRVDSRRLASEDGTVRRIGAQQHTAGFESTDLLRP
jgi:hypothetical protein